MRKYNPLKSGHPLIGGPCPVCEESFVVGDETTLMATVPASPEEAEKAQQGRAYNSQALPVHWACRGEG